LGAPQKLVDQSGAVVWSAQADPFGAATVDPASTVTNNLRFSSQYFDAESGLHYNTMRYYDPVAGRYVNRDPIGELGGVNLYGFVGNDGINSIDLLGLIYEFKVGECEAFIFIGHLNDKKFVDWDQDPCSIGGAVGCWPGPNNPSVPSQRWPNVPLHNEMVTDGHENISEGQQWYTDLTSDIPDTQEGDPRLERNLATAVRNALSRESKRAIMERLCSKCCEQVTFVINIGKDKWTDRHFGREWIKEAVAPFGYQPGKTYQDTWRCPSR